MATKSTMMDGKLRFDLKRSGLELTNEAGIPSSDILKTSTQHISAKNSPLSENDTSKIPAFTVACSSSSHQDMRKPHPVAML